MGTAAVAFVVLVVVSVVLILLLPVGDKGVCGWMPAIVVVAAVIVDVRKFVDLLYLSVGEDDVDELLPHNDTDTGEEEVEDNNDNDAGVHIVSANFVAAVEVVEAVVAVASTICKCSKLKTKSSPPLM